MKAVNVYRLIKRNLANDESVEKNQTLDNMGLCNETRTNELFLFNVEK